MLFDRLAGDFVAVDEDAALGPSNRMPLSPRLVTIISRAVGKIALYREIVRGVVTIVRRGIAVLQRDRVFASPAVDLDRAHALFVLLDGPGGDVDVMGAPVGELSTRILVPPAEIAVAARWMYSTFGVWPSQKFQSSSLGGAVLLNGPPGGRASMPTVTR